MKSILLVDTGADTSCVGSGFVVLSETGRTVTLRGYSDRSGTNERAPIVTAATAFDNNGTTVILVLNEAIYLGAKQYTSLLNLNQVRNAGHEGDDIPHFLSHKESIFGINTADGFHIPFTLKGKSAVIYVRTPTAQELDTCRHLILTSANQWKPDDASWTKIEKTFEARGS